LYRSRIARDLAGLVLNRRGEDALDLAHLSFYEPLASGPVQRDEALLLHALVKAIRPQTVVEIGFLHGHSAFNFLRALDRSARLYSFDIEPAAGDLARAAAHDPRLEFRLRSQEQITASDLDGRTVDLVFLDGAHDLALNRATFENLLPLLAEDALFVVHDTGAFDPSAIPEEWGVDPEAVGEGIEHQPEERAFVNWLLDMHPEFAQVHVHSRNFIRHGMTLLQRTRSLPRPKS
jgi:predicted O-methyltransferase YrrM